MSWLAAAICVLLVAAPAGAQEPGPEPTLDSAAVEIDGEMLFPVRGIEALPAARRAHRIEDTITRLAIDRSFNPETLHVEDRGETTAILAGPALAMQLSDVDAIEGMHRSLLAPVYVARIRRAIVEYREARTHPRLLASAGRAVAAVALAAAVVALLWRLLHRSEDLLRRAFERRTGVLGTGQSQSPHVGRLWASLHGAVGLVRIGSALLIALFLLEYVLVQFPWTRGAGRRLFASISEPLGGFAHRLVAAAPNLVLLAIIFFAARYGLSLMRLYFDAIERGKLRLRDFEPEWAPLTYNLLRAGLIAFALIIAYPLIPGSDSEAFKGLSILAGVVVSMGSSSAVANIMAGYMIIYRRAFRVGDRVQIGDLVGDVTSVRLQVTHLRTIKNEEITIPNSTILSSQVLNYSRPADSGKLLLHSEVGIGYETPWRQVQEMLIEAAHRTRGVEQEPPPMVLLLKLDTFSVIYQVNAHTKCAHDMEGVYADLHRNILDLFNEQGVQIMTPAYEGDPETPKIVAKEYERHAPQFHEH